LKENVIVGHLIPAGTGVRQFQSYIVNNKEELEKMAAAREAYEERAGEAVES